MKKVILFLMVTLLFVPAVFGMDIMPQSVSLRDTNTLGLYQASKSITLYKEPREDSHIVHSIKWSNSDIFPEGIKFQDLFVVFIPSKELALLAVTDETEDWVEVIYNNSNGSKGWLKKDDPYKFLTWINFYNMYGRKYGLYVLKGSPETVNDMHSATDDYSQVVSRMNFPQRINLNVIKGNWALVSVFDLDRQPKTGYVRWRANNGVKYLFPAIK